MYSNLRETIMGKLGKFKEHNFSSRYKSKFQQDKTRALQSVSSRRKAQTPFLCEKTLWHSVIKFRFVL